MHRKRGGGEGEAGDIKGIRSRQTNEFTLDLPSCCRFN